MPSRKKHSDGQKRSLANLRNRGTSESFTDRPIDANFAADVLRAIFEVMEETNLPVCLEEHVTTGNLKGLTLQKLNTKPIQKRWSKVKTAMRYFRLREYIDSPGREVPPI